MKRSILILSCVALAMIALLCRTAPAQTSSDDTSEGSHSDSSMVLRAPPTAFEGVGIGFGSALVSAGYVDIAPSNGSSASAVNVSASILTDPLNEGTENGIFGPRFGLIAGFQSMNLSGSGSNWDAAGSVVWNRPLLRLGAAVGIQSNAVVGTSGMTYNYSAFIEWAASQTMTLLGKLGEFSGGSSGNFLGGSILYYTSPDFALNGTILSSSLSSSYDFDLTLEGEYLCSEQEPFAIEAGYTQSFYSGFHIGQVFAGLKFFVNGDGIASLHDRERNGEPSQEQFKF